MSGDTKCSRQTGFSMIEILVTMVIVSVGLMGAGAMVINGLESNRNAYLRTQASILAYDMADRIRANSERANDYAGFSTEGAGTDVPDCFDEDAGCSSAEVETADKAQWAAAFQGVDGGFLLLPEAQGQIAQDGDDLVITVQWTQAQWNDDEGEVEDQAQNFVMRFNL